MAYGRTYIPRSAAFTAPTFPELHTEQAERHVLTEVAAAASFLFFIALLVGAMSFLIVVGPPVWGTLP